MRDAFRAILAVVSLRHNPVAGDTIGMAAIPIRS